MSAHRTPQPINLDTYARAEIFRAFVDRAMPQLSITCEVEVTHIRQACQALNVSFFIGMTYALSKAVNAVPEFRHRVINGQLCEFECIDPSYTVAREGGLFSFCDGVFIDDFDEYSREAQRRMLSVKHTPDLSVGPRHHMFFISSVPWLSFTAISHPYDPLYASVPVITMGKFSRRDQQWHMPIAVQAHHGLVDGVHLARFYETLSLVRLL